MRLFKQFTGAAGAKGPGVMQRDVYIEISSKLQEIRDKCGGELDLPQICVVGDQSSGKSSVLACTTGMTFPVK